VGEPRERRLLDFAGDSARLALGSALSQLILLAFTPVLGRLYGPAVVGTAAAAYAVVNVAGTIAAGRYEVAVMLPGERVDGLAALCVALIVCLGLSLSAALVGALAPSWLRLGLLTWALPTGLLSFGLSNAFTYWLLRERAFSWLSLGRITSSLAIVSWQGVVGFAGAATPANLVIGYLIGPFAVAIAGMVVLRRGGGGLRHALHRERLLAIARRFRRFPLMEAWGALLGALGLQVPILILSGMFPTATVGSFSMASRLLTAPVSFMGSAVGQVYFQRASALAARGGDIWALTRRLQAVLALIGAVPFLLVAVAGKPIFTWLLGPQWSDAGVFAQILAGASFLQLIYSPISPVFAVRRRLGSLTIVHSLNFSVPVIALLVGRVFLGPRVIPLVVTLSLSTGTLYLMLSLWNRAVARAPAPRSEHERERNPVHG
jgi:lipopolysaccharide exporter